MMNFYIRGSKTAQKKRENICYILICYGIVGINRDYLLKLSGFIFNTNMFWK